MRTLTFESKVEALVDEQGGEEFAALALDEFGLTYIDEVPAPHREFYLLRCIALFEEAQ